MSGRLFVTVLVVFCLIFGLALWWFQTRAFYERVQGVTEVMAYGDAFAVADYQGIDASTSPLKMRACFTVNWDYWPSDEFADRATPLQAPGWFDCFDAKAIGDDIQSGAATAILSDENTPYGFDTFIAQYEDGRAFMWRQINDCGTAVFDGKQPPDGCPPAPES